MRHRSVSPMWWVRGLHVCKLQHERSCPKITVTNVLFLASCRLRQHLFRTNPCKVNGKPNGTVTSNACTKPSSECKNDANSRQLTSRYGAGRCHVTPKEATSVAFLRKRVKDFRFCPPFANKSLSMERREVNVRNSGVRATHGATQTSFLQLLCLWMVLSVRFAFLAISNGPRPASSQYGFLLHWFDVCHGNV